MAWDTAARSMNHFYRNNGKDVFTATRHSQSLGNVGTGLVQSQSLRLTPQGDALAQLPQIGLA